MKITIDIKTDNAAFEDNPDELANIIHGVGVKIVIGLRCGSLTDSNGNTVGKFKVTGK
jgi:hypothetical protein